MDGTPFSVITHLGFLCSGFMVYLWLPTPTAFEQTDWLRSAGGGIGCAVGTDPFGLVSPPMAAAIPMVCCVPNYTSKKGLYR